MSKRHLLSTLAIISCCTVLFFIACSKGGSTPADPCSGITITVTGTATDADAGTADGSISVTASGASGLTYSINGGAFQSAASFSNLAAGVYAVTAKSSAGCTGSANITVNAKDLCAGKSISFSAAATQNSDPCTASGIVTLTASGSTGFTYNIDGGAFQTSAVFNGVAAGSHSFGAKDDGGCLKTTTLAVPALAAGPNFTAVKAVITANCAVSGCHAGTQAPNFTVDCNIVTYADLIKSRAVDQAGTGTQMPQPPRAALNQADRDKITAWITAGKQFTN
jgi:hypothetical protein